MNKKLTILALSLMCSLLLVPAALADSGCTQQAMSVYDAAGFTCNIGGILDFSNFVYSAAGPNKVTDANVTVNPLNNGNGVGFDFTGNWFAPDTTDVNIKFTVTALAGNLISDLYIFFGSVTTSGTGDVFYDETFCNIQGTCDLFVDHPSTASTNRILLKNSALGGPVTTLNITKDVGLSLGTGTGTNIARLSDFGNQYSYIPEPRSVSMLLGLGLLAGLAIKKRLAAQG